LHKNRRIFNADPPLPGSFEHSVLLKPSNNGDKYILQAGDVHGIATGAKFRVCGSNNVDAPSTIMTIGHVRDSTAELFLPEGYTNDLAGHTPLIARQTSAGPDEVLLVCASSENRIYSMLQQLAKQTDQSWKIQLVDTIPEDQEAPYLFVDLSIDDNNEVKIKVLDRRRCPLLEKKVKLDAPKKLPDLLRSIAHFRWHLQRVQHRSPAPLDISEINIEFSRLVQDPESDEVSFMPEAVSVKKLTPDTQFELEVGSEVTDDTPRYGFTIKSGLSKPLYVSMFHFDVNGFGISKISP
jgi:hypothetical protein